MQLKITRQPPAAEIADLLRERFEIGTTCEVSTLLGSVFLAEGWAEPVPEPDHAAVLRPTIDVLPFGGLVLLVDDEPAVRHLARILLTHHGYDVVVARHGEEAIARLSGKCPDLIVLDLHMPVMNGWQFRAAQRQLPPLPASVPVLLMTGGVDGDACAAALDAVGVVKKPFAAEALLNAVGAAIRQHRAQGDAGIRCAGHCVAGSVASQDPVPENARGVARDHTSAATGDCVSEDGAQRYQTPSPTPERRHQVRRRRAPEPMAQRPGNDRRGAGERRHELQIEPR
jgi:CheY-like chemotaxis protein